MTCTIGALVATGRETNVAGHPFLHPCQHCLRDFGGRVLHQRHRIRRSERYHSITERCLTEEEMWARGWYMDRYGRWRDSRKRPVGVRT